MTTYNVTTEGSDIDFVPVDADTPREAVRLALADIGYDLKHHPDRADSLVCRDQTPAHVVCSTYLANGESVDVVTVSELA